MFRSRAFFSLAAALWVGTAALAPIRADEAKPFRAGAATSNITPWIGLSINGGMSDHKVLEIHDELHARALVLDDGKTRLALVVCDSCMVPREVITAAKERIQEQTGIPADHVVISATHAHSCPAATPVFQSDPTEDYQRFLAVRIADAVQRASNHLAPARIGWGFGLNDRQVFNRRWHMKPGTVGEDPFGGTADQVKMNPPPGSPNLIEPAGPIDPRVAVVFVQSLEGHPIALLSNYSLHYVGGVGGGHASADYYGAFCDRVQQLLNADRLDPPFVAMMTNGTSGNINNVNFRVPPTPHPPYARIHAVADDIALEAVRVARALKFQENVTLDAVATDLDLGVRQPTAAELSRAEAILKQAEGKPLKTLPEIYARESVLIAKYPKTVPVTVQALRIGGLGIVAIPCEVFVEIGLELQTKSAIKPTFTISLANGYNGYLPTEAQHKLGGYETWRARSAYLEVNAAHRITATALALLAQLEGRTH